MDTQRHRDHPWGTKTCVLWVEEAALGGSQWGARKRTHLACVQSVRKGHQYAKLTGTYTARQPPSRPHSSKTTTTGSTFQMRSWPMFAAFKALHAAKRG